MTHYDNMNEDERQTFIDGALDKVVKIVTEGETPENNEELINIIKSIAKPIDQPDEIIDFVRKTCFGGHDSIYDYLTAIGSNPDLTDQTVALMYHVAIKANRVVVNVLLDLFVKTHLFDENVELLLMHNAILSKDQAEATKQLIDNRRPD